MKSFFLLFLLILTVFQGFAQIKDSVYLWPGKVPNEPNPKHNAIQTGDTSRSVCRLTDVTNPILIVSSPEPSVNNGAGVIICPGGGYSILAIDIEGYEVAAWLNKLGFTTFILQYRVPNNQLGALNDIQRAIRMVRSNTRKWKINHDQIGVLGFSAGGSLCARASTNYNKETYEKIDHIDTLSCRPDFAILIYPAYLDKGENRNLTPELRVDKNTPSMFIFGTADDKYGNSALVMTTALRDASVPVELHFLPSGGHGYGLRKGNIAAETWPVFAEKWLKNILKNK